LKLANPFWDEARTKSARGSKVETRMNGELKKHRILPKV